MDSTVTALAPAASASRFVEAFGLRLHYLDYGSAGRTPMLCLHGGAANAHWFDFVAASFTGGYHVRAMDHRGHGDSQWADAADYSYEHYAAEINEVVTRLDLRDFVLVGHSMGGKTSLTYASTYPGRVARLLVIDSNMDMTLQRLEQMRRMGRKPRDPYATREDFVAQFHVRPKGSNAAPEVTHHIALHCCKQMPEGTWRHKFDPRIHSEHKYVDSLACWEKIRIPAMLIKADLSERVTPKIRAEVKARCPTAEFSEVTNSHHHITLDNPSGFVRAMNDFLARHN
jgi:pimeloyl-ACP methyl ester carboxylesterase